METLIDENTCHNPGGYRRTAARQTTVCVPGKPLESPRGDLVRRTGDKVRSGGSLITQSGPTRGSRIAALFDGSPLLGGFSGSSRLRCDCGSAAHPPFPSERRIVRGTLSRLPAVDRVDGRKNRRIPAAASESTPRRQPTSAHHSQRMASRDRHRGASSCVRA